MKKTARVTRIINKVTNKGMATEKVNNYELTELTERGYMCIATNGGKYNITKI